MSARPAAAHLLAVAFVLGVAWLVFVQTRSYGLLGMDSYPILLTSRVQSLADLWGNFSERLMDGYYPAAFYRPLLNLSFALDHALWGLAAPGYQFTNVSYYAACALALYVFLLSRPVPRPPVYALAGVAFCLFHPLQFEVVPFPPRRPELMCATFMLLALAAEAQSGWRFRVLGGAAALLALTSKETAAILPALVFLRVLVYPGNGTLGGRWLTACRCSALSAVPVALYLAARFAVLRGMGGRGPINLEKTFEVFPQNLGTLLRMVTSPAATSSWQLAGVWLLLALPILIAACWRRGTGRRRWLPDFAFAAGWLFLLALIYTLSGRLSPWYVVVAIPAGSIAVAGICEGYGSWLGQRPWRWHPDRATAERTIGALGLAGVVLLISLSQLRWSPVLRSYPLWQRATAVDHQLLERFDRLLERAEPGSVVRILEKRKKIKGKGAATMFQGVVLQAHYSLQAWAALRHPGREVRVLKNRRPLKADPIEPSEVVVILDRQPRRKRGPAKVAPKGGLRTPVPKEGQRQPTSKESPRKLPPAGGRRDEDKSGAGGAGAG